MSGRHEPPTKRSFYFSLATSTVRFAVIVALAVAGVVVISKGFPNATTQGALTGGGGSTVTQSPAPLASEPPKEGPTAEVKGVHIGVFNGAGVTGLAADTAKRLQEKFEYVPDQITDAPSTVATTTLYYRSAQDKVEAQYMANHFFRGLEVKIARLPAGSGIERSVQVAVYLGNDYASAQQ